MRARGGGWWAILALIVLATVELARPARLQADRAPDGLVASPGRPRGIAVTVWPRKGETWAELARRMTGRYANAALLRAGGPARPPAGTPIGVSFDLLRPELQQEVLAHLLPGDRCEGSQWVHRLTGSFTPDRSAAALSRWFSSGDTGATLLEQALRAQRVEPGREVRLPCVGLAPWLAEARGCCQGLTPAEEEDRAEAEAGEMAVRDLLLAPPPPVAPASPGREAAPGDLLSGAPLPAPTAAAATPEPSPRPGSAEPGEPPTLRYGRDDKGAYAAYRLRAGDAVYSAVVIRYTGRVHAREVNRLVPVIAERSGVRSFTELPVGFEIKIPVELLAPEFQPETTESRRSYERSREDVARFRNRDVARGLEGVAVILDPGHGGRDRGAYSDAVWESDYVYDVMCRIKRALESRTRARVFTTLEDARIGYEVRERRRLEPARETYVKTNPRYRIEDPVVGVNLRWYLVNSLYRKLVREGLEPTRVVFTSIHADSLHPTVRGAMVYVPAWEHTGGRHGRRGPLYDSRQEVREKPFVSFSETERKRAEGLSRELAGKLLEAFRRRDMPVHAEKPVRGSVLRNNREWLPAVLRANQVPVRVLLEICNLNHEGDNLLLESPEYRQQVAEAYVEALLRYYGNPAPDLQARKKR